MSHTLISFLGKARKQEGSTYRTAHYDFGDQIKESQFFGLALLEVKQPDQLIILGTSGSMWDVFYEGMAQSKQQEEYWDQLIDAVEKDQVTQTLLNQCAKDLSDKIGIPCQLNIIPYGEDMSEQTEILQIMAKDIQADDQVSLDLTHGLRHLPMIGLLSAMYLKTAKQVSIEGIYYGALELTQKNGGTTPVMQLDGLLKISDWITALHGFDKTGDIAPFSELLQNEGVPADTANLLKTAAFHESVLSITKARAPLKDFTQQTKNGLSGIASLFSDSLSHRISWINKNDIYLRQRERALLYLEQRDYLRAASLGYEALISYQIKQGKSHLDIEDFDTRFDAKKDLEDHLRSNLEKWEAYKVLRGIRNTLSHTSRSDVKEVQVALDNEEELRHTLVDLFDALLPKTTH